MKTKLPESIRTIEEAKSFLSQLHANRELYHPEDDAHDVISWDGMPDDEAVPTSEQCDRLNKLMEDIYNLPGNDGRHVAPMVFDPCGYSLGINAIGVLNERYLSSVKMKNVVKTSHSDPIIHAVNTLNQFDIETEEGKAAFLEHYGELTLGKFIEAMEPTLGSENMNAPIQAAEATFLELANELQQRAVNYVKATIKEPVTYLPDDIEQEDGLSDMPDFNTYSNDGDDNGWANLTGIQPTGVGVLLRGIHKETGEICEEYMHSIETASACAIADYVKAITK